MNGLLWLGVACTGLLVLSIAVDGLEDLFDSLDVGPGWLDLSVIAAFFGAFGWIAGAAIGPLGPIALVLGLAGGVAFGYGTVRLSKAFLNMPTDPTDRQDDLLGSFGRVVEAPRPGRYGAVLLNRPAGPVKVAAAAEVELPAGTEVVVVDVVSSTLVTVEAFPADA